MEKSKAFPENPPADQDINPLDDLIQDLDEILADFEENLPPVKTQEEVTEPEAVPQKETGDRLDKDYQAMIGTFVEIMQNALKPVTRYVKAIRKGNHARELFELIDFTVSPLIPKVKEVELHEVASRMESLSELVLNFTYRENEIIEKKELRKLFKQYKPLHDILHLEYRGSRKAVSNILRFYKLLREDDLLTVEDIRRFFAIGVPSITAIRKTSANDLTSLSGIPVEKTRRIKNIVYRYREAHAANGQEHLVFQTV